MLTCSTSDERGVAIALGVQHDGLRVEAAGVAADRQGYLCPSHAGVADSNRDPGPTVRRKARTQNGGALDLDDEPAGGGRAVRRSSIVWKAGIRHPRIPLLAAAGRALGSSVLTAARRDDAHPAAQQNHPPHLFNY